MCTANPLPSPTQQPSLVGTPSGIQDAKPVAISSPNPLTSVSVTPVKPVSTTSVTSLPVQASGQVKFPTSLMTQTSLSVSSQGQCFPPTLSSGLTAQQQGTTSGQVGPSFGHGLKLPGQGTSFAGSPSASPLVGLGQPRSQAGQPSKVEPPLTGGGVGPTLGGLLSSQSVGSLSSVKSTTLVSVDRPLGVPLHYSTPVVPPPLAPAQPPASTQIGVTLFTSGGLSQSFSTVSSLSPNVKPTCLSDPPTLGPTLGQPLVSTPHAGIGLKLQQTPSTSVGQSAMIVSTAVPTQRQLGTPQHILPTPRGPPIQSSSSSHITQPVQSQPTLAQQVEGQIPSQPLPMIPRSSHPTPSRHQDDAEVYIYKYCMHACGARTIM